MAHGRMRFHRMPYPTKPNLCLLSNHNTTQLHSTQRRTSPSHPSLSFPGPDQTKPLRTAPNHLSPARPIVLSLQLQTQQTRHYHPTHLALSNRPACSITNFPQGWPKFAASAVLFSPTTNSFVVASLLPLSVQLPFSVGGGAKLLIATSYPFGDSANLTVTVPEGHRWSNSLSLLTPAHSSHC